jgi:hypothetical protein
VAAATGGLAAGGGEPVFRYANTWDLNFDVGVGYAFGDVGKWSGLARGRAGALIVRNDNFYQLGATAEYVGLVHRPAFGLQAEYLHLQLGTWFEVGASVDTKGRIGGMASAGLSIVGVEAEVRQFENLADPSFALFAKIRVPIGILVYGLQTRK